MQFNISGYSTALFSTWYFIEELDLLFDCGDGCVAALLQKGGKVKHIFISHADRDHLSGLLHFSQLNNRTDFPKLFFPADSGSFPALNEFSSKFDPHIEKRIWSGIRSKEEIYIRKDIVVTAVRNSHVEAMDNIHKSLGYLVERVRRKLRPEFLNLSGKEIADLRKTRTEEELTYEVRDKLIAYSGDTPPENEDFWNNTEVLIHEATFLDRSSDDDDPRQNKHSILEDVIKMVSRIKINKLILGHFSVRYSNEEIISRVNTLISQYKLKCEVKLVLPGSINFNILTGKPEAIGNS